MQTVSKEKQAGLINILRQDLDDYGLEIVSYAALDELSGCDMYEVKRKVERFLDALNKVLGEQE